MPEGKTQSRSRATEPKPDDDKPDTRTRIRPPDTLKPDDERPEKGGALPPPTRFEIKTRAQVERTYVVIAGDDTQAHARLRQYLADADALRPEVVTMRGEGVNVTPEKTYGAIHPYKGDG